MIKINKKLISDLGNFMKMRYDIDISGEEIKKYPEAMHSFMRLQHWMDEILLNRYFQASENPEEEGIYWTQQLEFDTRRTGKMLQERLQSMPNADILDVGCGDNDWKKLLGDRVHGIDPYNTNADTVKGIMDFKTDHKWKVVLALGSINFGDENTIFEQVKRVTELVAPGGLIFWRCNPGITHDNKHAQWIDFYPWSHEKMQEFADKIGGFEIDVLDWDHQGDDTIRWGNRIYSEWRRTS